MVVPKMPTPRAPLMKARDVPTGASLFKPSMMATLSAQNSTCNPGQKCPLQRNQRTNSLQRHMVTLKSMPLQPKKSSTCAQGHASACPLAVT